MYHYIMLILQCDSPFLASSTVLQEEVKRLSASDGGKSDGGMHKEEVKYPINESYIQEDVVSVKAKVMEKETARNIGCEREVKRKEVTGGGDVSTAVENMIPRSRQVEFVTLRVKGQSFMIHQIRKMIGLVIAIVRGFTLENTLMEAFGKKKVRNILISLQRNKLCMSKLCPSKLFVTVCIIQIYVPKISCFLSVHRNGPFCSVFVHDLFVFPLYSVRSLCSFSVLFESVLYSFSVCGRLACESGSSCPDHRSVHCMYTIKGFTLIAHMHVSIQVHTLYVQSRVLL